MNYDTLFEQSKTNEQYSFAMRIRLLRYHQLKQHSRVLSENWQDEIRDWRKVLKRHLEHVPQTIIYDEDDYESWTVIYKEPMYFEGTREELDEELWEDQATVITSPYDCTGLPFTRGFIIVKIGENLWRVAEKFGIDV